MLARIEEFTFSDHFLFLQTWLVKRDVKIDADELANLGWVCYVGDDPVAMLWLRKTGKVGFIEGVITNPEAWSEERNLALDMLTQKALEEARKLEISKVIGYSVDNGIMSRAQKFGFEIMPHKLCSISIGGS